ncbi:DUF3800 domain-containing protein [Taklimakanibacter lacteus]|uniref:DUF3800 domain-containing protein n=1 Tax=Taklimakanibacter lacteus TaxID=2268456 RepID=UPI000E671395
MGVTADRVVAQVAGMRPSIAIGWQFVALQAFIDDSYKGADSTFVLAGHIATAESWAHFAKEWEEMLPFGTINQAGIYHFKMSEMAASPERLARVPGFFRIIERHVLMSISCAYNLADAKRAMSRISIPGVGIDWSFVANPFLMCSRLLLDVFNARRSDLARFGLPTDEPVDFYFDNQAEKKVILTQWESFAKSRRELFGAAMGATPRFEDDTVFLPLQAADLWAWWVRRAYDDGDPMKVQRGDFGAFRAKRNYPRIHVDWTQKEILEGLLGMLKQHINPDDRILVAPA